MNNKFHAMFRQGATVIVVIILAIAAFWLVGRQAQPGSQPTAQDTDRPPPPPATPQPTVPPTPLPTAIPTATPTAAPPPNPTQTPFTPEVSFGKGSLVTLPPPGPTSTPTPTSSIRVVNKSPLALNNILAALGTTQLDTPRIVAWTPQEGIVLQMGYPPQEMTWAISPETGQAQQVVHLETTSIQSNEVLAAIDDLKAINSRIQITAVSPDEQWIAGGVIDERVLLIKQVGSSQPPLALLSETAPGSFADFLAWSPSSGRLAYAVYTGKYEIRISDPQGLSTSITDLGDAWRPFRITWSPDEQLIAFIAQIGPQQMTDVYVMKSDGTNLANLTQDETMMGGNIAWSPDSRRLAYSDYTQIWIIAIAMN